MTPIMIFKPPSPNWLIIDGIFFFRSDFINLFTHNFPY